MEDIEKILRRQDRAMSKVLGVGGSSRREREPLKRKTYSADFYDLMEKQNHLCADSKCSKRHGRRQSVNSTRDMDHKFPIKLWELMKKKGNVNDISNLQLLCPGCHRIKTAADKKAIAEYKQKKVKRGQSNPYGVKPINFGNYKPPKGGFRF